MDTEGTLSGTGAQYEDDMESLGEDLASKMTESHLFLSLPETGRKLMVGLLDIQGCARDVPGLIIRKRRATSRLIITRCFKSYDINALGSEYTQGVSYGERPLDILLLMSLPFMVRKKVSSHKFYESKNASAASTTVFTISSPSAQIS